MDLLPERRMNMKTQLRAGNISISLLAVLALGVPLTACSGKKPAEAPTASSNTETADSKEATDDPKVAGVTIGPRIAEACGIAASDSYFDYNSSRVSPKADELLAAVATCFTTGPLAGKNMRVVGHADPRGDEEFNMALGGKRSDNIASALSKKGLPENQMEASSRGEIDARGSDEQSWAKDRKVELMLAE